MSITRAVILDRLATVIAGAAPGWTVVRDRNVPLDDVATLAASELPLINVVDAGEETTPPDNAPRAARLWHWTATADVELYARTASDVSATSMAVVAALAADEELAGMLEDAPGVEVRPRLYPDGVQLAAAQMTITLPYCSRPGA